MANPNKDARTINYVSIGTWIAICFPNNLEGCEFSYRIIGTQQGIYRLMTTEQTEWISAKSINDISLSDTSPPDAREVMVISNMLKVEIISTMEPTDVNYTVHNNLRVFRFWLPRVMDVMPSMELELTIKYDGKILTYLYDFDYNSTDIMRLEKRERHSYKANGETEYIPKAIKE